MRACGEELRDRARFIREHMAWAGVNGLVFGNSGGKDSALAGILCKYACENTLGLIMPCASRRNYGEDKEHAEALAAMYGIATRLVDLSGAYGAMRSALGDDALSAGAAANIAPRLRMAALYAVAASEGRLVVGTGNRSEIHMGYFTKWGDGACDINPIADLTATQVLALLGALGAPRCIIEKAPSAGLYEGQTDEAEMGVTYGSIDAYLLQGEADAADAAIIKRAHDISGHKRRTPVYYAPDEQGM